MSAVMNDAINREERLLKIILAPVVSEKATMVADKRQQVTLRVASDASKPEVKAAVEMLFGVKVKDVNIATVKGKGKRFGRLQGRRSDWKKAYVSLQPGQEINFAGE
jgi:large subunit ribosomal protein L23